MAANNRQRTNDAFLFPDFPIDDLVIRPPSHVVEGIFGIPDIEGSREPFINLTPNRGEWLRVCFDVDVDHVSTLKDSNGVPRAFKLTFHVEAEQEEFMRKVNKRFHKLFLESLQGRGQPIPKVEWRPILTEKEGMAPYFSAKVNLRETAIKIYDSTAEQKLRVFHRAGGPGTGWDVVKDFRFCNARAKLVCAPARVWLKEGKAGVAFEASLLVVEETRPRPAVNDCFGENDL